MRIYIAIAAVAVVLLVTLFSSAPLWIGDYLSTEEFRRTAFVELVSFIATSAVVGGLSAAVADYLRRRELLPLRRHAFERVDSAVLRVVQCLKRMIMDGPDPSHLAFFSGRDQPRYVIVTKGYQPFLPRRVGVNSIALNWQRILDAIADLHRTMDRYAMSFAVDRQSDLAEIEQFLDKLQARMDFIAYQLGTRPGYRSGPETPDEVRADYLKLSDALRRLAAECGLMSRAAEAIGDPALLAADARHIRKNLNAVHAANPDAAKFLPSDWWWDYGWTLDDMKAHIKACVPLDLVGGYERAIAVDHARVEFGADKVRQWMIDYPPPRPPDLRLVE